MLPKANLIISRVAFDVVIVIVFSFFWHSVGRGQDLMHIQPHTGQLPLARHFSNAKVEKFYYDLTGSFKSKTSFIW